MAGSARSDESRGMETNQMSAHWSATAVEVDPVALLCALLVGIAEGGEATSELAFPAESTLMVDWVQPQRSAISDWFAPRCRKSEMSDFQSMAVTLSNNRYHVKRFLDIGAHYPPRMREKARSDYGLRLLKAREHAGLTQTALSKSVGMSQSAYASAETNGQGSTYTSQLAAACGVRAEWLATGQGPMIAKAASHAVSAAAAAVNEPPDVMQALTVLAGALSKLDKPTREGVAGMLAMLAKEPEQAESTLAALGRWLTPTNLAHIPHDSQSAGRGVSSSRPTLEETEIQGHAKRNPDQRSGRT
jgi:transcriptional regulator with XRE-family HTH domain